MVFKILSVLKILYLTRLSKLLVMDLLVYSKQKSSSLKLLSFIKILALHSNHNLCWHQTYSFLFCSLTLKRSNSHVNKIVPDPSKTRFLMGTQKFLFKFLAGHLIFEHNSYFSFVSLEQAYLSVLCFSSEIVS